MMIQKSPKEQEIIGKLEPVVESLGYSLRDLEINARNAVVCVTIEKSASTSSAESNAIGIQDCETVHKTISPLFDVWDPMSQAYTLEVSSPGESPVLRTTAHFIAACGEMITFQTHDALPMPPPAKPRRNWKGILKSFNEATGELLLLEDQQEHRVDIRQIKTAQLIRDWTLGNKKEK